MKQGLFYLSIVNFDGCFYPNNFGLLQENENTHWMSATTAIVVDKSISIHLLFFWIFLFFQKRFSTIFKLWQMVPLFNCILVCVVILLFFFHLAILKCLSYQVVFLILIWSFLEGEKVVPDDVQYIIADWICQAWFSPNIVLYFICYKN